MTDRPTNEKICPKCGANTVEKTPDRMFPTYPPQVPIVVWCGCGYEAEVGIRRVPMPDDDLLERWKKANQ